MAKLKLLVLIFISLSLTVGCTQVSRSIGKITDNKFAEARSGTNWVVAPPQLEPPAPEDKNVYISYRNISDADIDLLAKMKTAAQQQGWTIVNDPTKAKYRLRASLRYFGEVAPESGGASVARGLGAISGAAIGVATYKAGGSSGNSALAGLGAGAASGSLISAGLANGSRPREWALIIDFVLEEHTSKPVEFTLSTGSDTAMTSAAGARNSRMGVGGAEKSGNSKNATMTKKSNYYPHGVRLSVWANQMNMKQEEALPHIIKRTEKVITKLLPM